MTIPKNAVVSDLRAELAKRGLSTDGLKQELVNRLQVRLDEEEFGLAEAPTTNSPSVPAGTVPSPAIGAAAASIPASTEKEPELEKVIAVGAEKKSDPDTTEKEEGKIVHSSEDAPSKESSTTAVESRPVSESAKVMNTKGMTFEEKKKARAARFNLTAMPASSNSDGLSKLRKRERGNRGGREKGKRKKHSERIRGDDVSGKKSSGDKKSNKSVFDSLSKEELEKRLERARKYGVVNENVDAMKSALRSFRFEKK